MYISFGHRFTYLIQILTFSQKLSSLLFFLIRNLFYSFTCNFYSSLHKISIKPSCKIKKQLEDFFAINSIRLNRVTFSGVKQINRRNFCLMLYSIKRTDHRRAHEPLGLVGACCTSLPSAR